MFHHRPPPLFFTFVFTLDFIPPSLNREPWRAPIDRKLTDFSTVTSPLGNSPLYLYHPLLSIRFSLEKMRKEDEGGLERASFRKLYFSSFFITITC